MPPKRSNQPNLHQLRRSLARQAESARRLDDGGRADAFWTLWEEASRFGSLEREYWWVGRNAIVESFRTGNDVVALARIKQFLPILERIGLAQQAGRMLTNAGAHFSDASLLEVVTSTDMSRAIFAALSDEVRDRVAGLLDAANRARPSPQLIHLVGRVLDSAYRTEISEIAASERERTIEARALRFVRSQGTETVAGIRYEALYGLWRVLTEDDIDAIAFQDLEDITLIHRRGDGSHEEEHVQAKKRDEDWSIRAVQSKAADGNKVFDSFVKVYSADRGARFTFATDSRLAKGYAPDLERVSRKFRDISTDLMALASGSPTRAAISDREQQALDQLAGEMAPQSLASFTLPELLARVTFDTGRTRRELRSELIRHISAILGVPDPGAELAYHAFVDLFIEAMEQRKRFTRTEINAIVEQAAVLAGAFDATLAASGHLDAPDFDSADAASANRYYQGFSTSPADIAAGFDALRPALLAEVDRGLAAKRCCVIRSSSGQGKTTLMYRYAYEVSGDNLILRLHMLSHAAVTDAVRATSHLKQTGILVLVDDLARGERTEWPVVLRRLLEIPNVRVIATSREDDWRIADVQSVEELVEFVHLSLNEDTAQVIFEGLRLVAGVQLHAEHWREPFEQSHGLLMEYVHLLTQGRRMVDLIAEQIADLEAHIGATSPALVALRYIATAHSYGGYLTRATLAKLLPGVSTLGLGRALRVLEREFWVRDTEQGRYVGLHQVRSVVVRDVLHADDPLGETLARLLDETDAEELGAMLEDVLYQVPDAYPNAIGALAERATREGPTFALRVATAAYAAEERRYAHELFAALHAPGRAARAYVGVMSGLPGEFDAIGHYNNLPEPGRTGLLAAAAGLPSREWARRADRDFLARVGASRIGAWLRTDATARDAEEILLLLSMVAPDLGKAVLDSVGVDELVTRLRIAPVEEMGGLLAAIREVSVPVAVAVADRLSMDFMIERAATLTGCYAVTCSGTTVRGQFLIGTNETESAHAAVVRITRMLYDLFPAATDSEVTGFIGTGLPHPDATKTIPRVSLPPTPFVRSLRAFWMSLCSEQLSAPSAVSVLRTHDEYGEKLLSAVAAIKESLDGMSSAAANHALAPWESAAEIARQAPYLPHRTAALLAGMAQDALPSEWPGSQPLDKAFESLSGAAGNVQREIGNYVHRSQRFNRAILLSQLAEMEELSRRYTAERANFASIIESGGDWPTRLADEAARLRHVLTFLTQPRPNRAHRQESNRVFAQFAELRAVAAQIVTKASRAVEDDSEWLSNDLAITAFRDAIGGIDSRWWGILRLSDLADVLAEIAAAQTEDSGDPFAMVDAARTMLADIQCLAAIDLEAWLVGTSDEQELGEAADQIGIRLGVRGIAARCTVLAATLDAPLLRSLAVIVRVENVDRLSETRQVIRDEGFAHLPSTIQRIVLFAEHQPGAILPFAYQTWRSSGQFTNPYDVFNPYVPWYPLADTEIVTLTAELNLHVDHRDHTVARAIQDIQGNLVLFVQKTGQIAALPQAIGDPAERPRYESLARQLRDCRDCLHSLRISCEGMLSTGDEYPDWQSVIASTIDGVSAVLDWYLRTASGSNEPADDASLTSIFIGLGDRVANALYFGLIDGDPQSAAMVSVRDRFASAIESARTSVESIEADVARMMETGTHT